MKRVPILLEFFRCQVVHFNNWHGRDKFVGRSIEFLRIFCKLRRHIRVIPNHHHRDGDSQNHRNQHNKSHNPVQPQHENKHHKRNDNRLCQFQCTVRQKLFYSVHIVKKRCLDLSGRAFLKKAQVESGYMFQHLYFDFVHGIERCYMRADTRKRHEDGLPDGCRNSNAGPHSHSAKRHFILDNQKQYLIHHQIRNQR